MMFRGLFIAAMVFVFQGAYASSADIVGKWKTIDDETQKPKSIVEIYKNGNSYQGKIVQLFKEPGEDQNPLCTKCKDTLLNKPILGLVILNDLKKRDSDWGDGTILDPNNGKTYDVKMELAEQGAKLKVRGFIGFSLLGRSQVWHRVL